MNKENSTVKPSWHKPSLTFLDVLGYTEGVAPGVGEGGPGTSHAPS